MRMNNEPRKDTVGKLRYDLIPAAILEELAKIYTAGSIKYGDNCWQRVPTKHYEAALFRHLQEWRKGNSDSIEGDFRLKHLGQCAWNALTIMWKEMEDEQKDTRDSVQRDDRGSQEVELGKTLHA